MTNERQQRAARAEQMRKEREKADRKQRNLITVAIVVVVLALVIAGGWAIKTTSDSRAQETDVITPKGATEDFGVVYDAEAAGGEPASDAVEVVLYEDFQCPVCKSFEQANGAYLDEAVKKGEITIEYRIIAFLDRASQNEYSSRAGSAAMCAQESGGVEAYKQVSNLLFANQPAEGTAGPEDPALVETLNQAGVTGEAAEQCVVTGRFIPWIEKATEASRDAKVEGTPTVLIDGKKVQGAQGGVPQLPDLQKAIDAAKTA
ncbi:DsbA family protein [Aeromicrobium sp.]|uniref:DsbA family protein n=1 Tax=Aeromicrobium sp. TaxID=1871063 RepID=UPI003D6C2D2C